MIPVYLSAAVLSSAVKPEQRTWTAVIYSTDGSVNGFRAARRIPRRRQSTLLKRAACVGWEVF